MGASTSTPTDKDSIDDTKTPDLEKGSIPQEEEKKNVDPRQRRGGKLDDEQKATLTPSRLLLYGALEGNKDIVKQAREAGGDVNTPDTGPVLKQGQKPSNDAYANLVTGNYPLHMAAQNGHTEMITLLFHFEANLENKNKIGSTALHTAVSHNHIDVVRELLKLGAKVGALNSMGNTAIHLAAYTGNIEMMHVLLQHGGTRFIHAKNKVEMTPVDYARKKQMIDYLTNASVQSGHPMSIPRGIPEADELKERKSMDETISSTPHHPLSPHLRTSVDQLKSSLHIEDDNKSRNRKKSQDMNDSSSSTSIPGSAPILDESRAMSESNIDVVFHHHSPQASPAFQPQGSPSPTSSGHFSITPNKSPANPAG